MPLLAKLKAERKSNTLDFPFQPSRRWQQFFIRLKLTHLCFHCLRVTYINRLRRAGVPREAAMRLVNHASALVHEIYQREKVDDVMQWRDAVKFPISKTSSLRWRKQSETDYEKAWKMATRASTSC
jgi:integrase